MSVHRRNPRRDSNEAAIIGALEQIGATVQPISATGTPDLLVGYQERNYLIEIKTTKGKLTDDQTTWHAAWNGQKAIARTIEEAFAIIGVKVTS